VAAVLLDHVRAAWDRRTSVVVPVAWVGVVPVAALMPRVWLSVVGSVVLQIAQPAVVGSDTRGQTQNDGWK
jgi:hypothetical protein